MLKELIEKMEILEAESDRLDDLLENDPENKDIEADWGRAYNASFEAHSKVVDYIVKLIGVDEKIARAMIATKREELKAIAEKEAV
jgi:hypothetical protein